MRGAAAAFAVLAGTAGVARADGNADQKIDGYCDWVTNVAASQADFFEFPNVIGTIAYIKEPTVVTNPPEITSGLRGTLLLEWNVIGVLEGQATKRHGDDDCKKHKALDRVQGETVYKALRAKLKIYNDALEPADKILQKAVGDKDAHRTTAQEVVATRVRVNELHDLQNDTRLLIDALPRPGPDEQLGGALAAYYKYDDLMEKEEGKLRRLQGLNVSIGAGPDIYFGTADAVPFTALFQVTLNTGIFAQGGANERAAEGRRHMVREQHQVQLVDTTIAHIQNEVKSEQQRAEETAALESDLKNQMEQIEKIGGDDNLRYRDTVWFDYVKVRAEHAYFVAHVESLTEVLGEIGLGQ
jgi:hypothetical protein